MCSSDISNSTYSKLSPLVAGLGLETRKSLSPKPPRPYWFAYHQSILYHEVSLSNWAPYPTKYPGRNLSITGHPSPPHPQHYTTWLFLFQNIPEICPLHSVSTYISSFSPYYFLPNVPWPTFLSPTDTKIIFLKNHLDHSHIIQSWEGPSEFNYFTDETEAHLYALFKNFCWFSSIYRYKSEIP